MKARHLLVVLAVAVLVGCGGSEPREGAPPPERAPTPDYGRLSGSSLYASLDELRRGWKTDFARHTVPLTEFQRGGPGRDGIERIDNPWVVIRP